MRHRLPTLILTLALFGAAPAAGQAVLGQLRDATTGAPIPGAMVTLTDPEGNEIDQKLTDAEGRYMLRAPAAGAYRISGERIGFTGGESTNLLLGQGRMIRYDLELQQTAVELSGLTVRGASRCVLRPEVGEQTFTLWEEARKALSAVSWTRGSGAFRFVLDVYERDLELGSLTVLQETRQTIDGYSEQSFQGLPPERLREMGFVDRTTTRPTYYAPDAEALLSDAFLDTHCFRIVDEREDDGLVGLAFEPVPGREVPEIEGTLWLDRETAELRSMDYRYVQLHIDTDVAGGHVEFDRLEDGPWLVRSWWIRMPQIGRREENRDWWSDEGPRDVVQVVGLREVGGQVIRVDGSGALAAIERGVLVGTVYDSVRLAPLAEATVYIDGTQFSTTTNARGEFMLDSLPDGAYTLSFYHERSSAEGTATVPAHATVRGGVVDTVSLALRCADDAPQCGNAAVALAGAREGPDPKDVVELEGVRVEGRMARNAEVRRRRGTRADYLGPEEVAEIARVTNFAGLLRRANFPSLTIRETPVVAGSSIMTLCIENNRTRNRSPQICNPVDIYINGVQMANAGEYLLDMNPNWVVSLEYLPPLESGARYGILSQNGVLVVETK